jgi:23S rRNA pseudouridine2605 synthase
LALLAKANPMALERLQKIISRSGLASRRKAEEWIVAGRVSVNGQVIRELGTKADTETDHISVDGKAVRPPTRLVYIALNKPREYMTTRLDPEGRPTVMDLIKKVKEPVYPVGRLDFQSEGLLFLTNDGEFANRLTSTASQIPKTYWVKVQGMPPEKELEKLRRGIVLDGRRTLPASIKLLRTAQRAMDRSTEARTTEARTAESRSRESSDKTGANAWYEIVITEGRQNQIRRMFSLIGYRVQKLKRVEIGSFALGDLAAGEFRYLIPADLHRVLSQKRAAEAHRPFRLDQKPRKPFFRPHQGNVVTAAERKQMPRFSGRSQERKARSRPSPVHRNPRSRS